MVRDSRVAYTFSASMFNVARKEGGGCWGMNGDSRK